MPALHILYEAKDHQNKAQALENASAHSATIDPADATPRKITGLNTLVFWGHGDENKLCGLTSSEILKTVSKWRDKNSKLNTVEIITCNARHFEDKPIAKTTTTADGHVTARTDSKGKQIMNTPKVYLKSMLTHLGDGQRINNSMAKQVKRGLKYSIYPSLRDLHLKSMPESSAGAFQNSSILLWEQATTSWCYICAPSQPEMFAIQKNIQYTKRNPPDPVHEHGGARTGDFPTRLAAAKIDFPASNYSDVQAGMIVNLRTILVPVH
jgi:hypothetical protein